MSKKKNKQNHTDQTNPAPSPSPTVENNETSNPANNKGKKGFKKTIHDLLGHAISMPTLTLLILVTYVLANFFSCQQMKITESALKVDQRAWLRVDMGDIEITENAPILCNVKLTINGKTPAQKINFMGLAEIVKDGNEPNFSYKDRAVASDRISLLMPSEPLSPIQVRSYQDIPPSSSSAPPLIVDHTAYTDLVAGKTWVAVHGQITYTDFFGDQRWVHFCGYRSIYPGSISIHGAYACAKYNEMN